MSGQGSSRIGRPGTLAVIDQNTRPDFLVEIEVIAAARGANDDQADATARVCHMLAVPLVVSSPLRPFG
jgi:hypothetical protein